MLGHRTLVLLLACLALLALALAPAAAEAVKLPQPGKIGFKHVVLKTKKGKKRAGQKAKRRSGAKFKLRVRNRKRLPKSAHVYARISRLKKRNTFAADFVAINARPARSSGAPGADEDELKLQPGDEIEIVVRAPGGQVIRILITVEDDDVAGDDPQRTDSACGDLADDTLFVQRLHGRLLGMEPRPRDVLMYGGNLFCDEPGVPDSFFDVFGLVQPPATSCSGSLSFAPPPFNLSEFEVDEVCTGDKTGMGFLMPSGRQVENFLPLQTFTSCEIQSRSGGTNNFLMCQGNQPAGRHGKVRIHPNPAPMPGMTVDMFPFQGGTQLGGPFPTAGLCGGLCKY